MVDLKYQKRMAAEVMKCGRARVYFDPNKTEDISEAVTRGDIKSLIKNKVITKKQKKGVSRGRARHIARQKKKGKRKGPGSRKGGKYARFPKKRRWIATIRPMRRILKEYRDGGYIDRSTYRKFYLQAKGGMFKNKGHLESHMKTEKVFKKPIPKKEKAAPVPKSEAPKKKSAAKKKLVAPGAPRSSDSRTAKQSGTLQAGKPASNLRNRNLRHRKAMSNETEEHLQHQDAERNSEVRRTSQLVPQLANPDDLQHKVLNETGKSKTSQLTEMPKASQLDKSSKKAGKTPAKKKTAPKKKSAPNKSTKKKEA